MNNTTYPKLLTMKEIIAQNPKMNLREFYEWQEKKQELEAGGIDTNPPREPQKQKRQQPIPLSVLGL